MLSKVERAEVCRVWDTMPGSTTFVDALEAIAQGYDPDRVDVVIPDDVACSGVCDGYGPLASLRDCRLCTFGCHAAARCSSASSAARWAGLIAHVRPIAETGWIAGSSLAGVASESRSMLAIRSTSAAYSGHTLPHG